MPDCTEAPQDNHIIICTIAAARSARRPLNYVLKEENRTGTPDKERQTDVFSSGLPARTALDCGCRGSSKEQARRRQPLCLLRPRRPYSATWPGTCRRQPRSLLARLKPRRPFGDRRLGHGAVYG